MDFLAVTKLSRKLNYLPVTQIAGKTCFVQYLLDERSNVIVFFFIDLLKPHGNDRKNTVLGSVLRY